MSRKLRRVALLVFQLKPLDLDRFRDRFEIELLSQISINKKKF